MRIKTSGGVILLPDGISAEEAEKAIASLDNLPLPTFVTKGSVDSLDIPTSVMKVTCNKPPRTSSVTSVHELILAMKKNNF